MRIPILGTPTNPSLLGNRRAAQVFPKDLTMVERINENQLAKEFDLIVIGGGINGCGIARDASERGLKVLLLEKEDFGAGCTSASTRLIHGGLRYLENLEIGLVRESLRERELLLKNANHLVRPLELCIPIYRDDKRGYWLIKAGMLLYDFLSFDKSLPKHRMMSSEEFINYEPSIKRENLLGAALYYDTQVTYAERLCVENALMAKQTGATVLNHAKVTGINIDAGKVSSIEFIDCLSGKQYKVHSQYVVNVSGPWVDSLCELTSKNIERQIGGTKGSHIIVRKFEDGPKNALYVSAKSDGRPFFIIPWQDYYLIGTTDIPYSGNLDNISITEAEIKYLIEESNQVIKTKKLTYDDILFSYSGVRPLPYSKESNPAKITRRHIIHEHNKEGVSNLISIIGGKLTTYRNLSEQTVDLIYKKIGYSFVPSTTKSNPLIGNFETDQDLEIYKKSQAKRFQKKYELDQDILLHLLDLYGSRCKSVLDLTLKDTDLGRLLDSHALDIRAQVIFSLKNELACTISDVLLRRMSLGLSEGLGQDSIPEVSKLMQEILGLTTSEIEKQIKDYEENVVKLRRL